jgi:hypothetical protein
LGLGETGNDSSRRRRFRPVRLALDHDQGRAQGESQTGEIYGF